MPSQNTNRALNKAIATLFIFLISYTFSYEAVAYLAKHVANCSIVATDDFECEENTSEPEKSDEAKKEIADDDRLLHNGHHQLPMPQLGSLRSGHISHIAFSDHSNEVYSPPEA